MIRFARRVAHLILATALLFGITQAPAISHVTRFAGAQVAMAMDGPHTLQQEAYVRKALAPHIGGTYYNLSGRWDLNTDNIYLGQWDYGLMTIPVNEFTELYKDGTPDLATVPESGPYPVYDAWVAIDAAKYGGGWKPYFDQWKAEGLIN